MAERIGRIGAIEEGIGVGIRGEGMVSLDVARAD